MAETGNIQKPLKEFYFFFLQIASTLITAIFLIVWVAIQWGVNHLIGMLHLSGIDQTILWIFQGIFGVTTLIPIVVYYYVDTRIIWIRAQRRISEEYGDE
jgi:hypothetical protein